MSNQTSLQKIILENKVLTPEQLKAAVQQAAEKRIPLEDELIGENLISEALLYETLASGLNLPYTDLTAQNIRRDILTLLPEPIIQVHNVAVFDRTDTEVKLAMTDPHDLQVIDFVAKKTNRKPVVYVTTPTGIKNVLKQYRRTLHGEFEHITASTSDSAANEQDLKQLAQDVPVIRVVDTLLEYAVFEGASDIHIEPTEHDTIIRYRIDGVLREVMTLPKKVQSGVVARIKILSNLKIDEHRLPQDGRFKIHTDEYTVAFRVSILPVFDGEKVVLRLLNESAQVLSLEQLGLQPQALAIVQANVKKPHGQIFVSGPTGSGKTTTLYTIISVLNTPKVNISTIEDPIEYRMPRVNQTQVNPKIGMTFAAGLRALLRQDPNIIMVGEIRDEETAEISAHAALTGHLVLSTIHTNDAVTVLPRLTEMKVPTFLIASTTNMIIAQRLVRKICQHCIESYTMSRQALIELQKQIKVDYLVDTLINAGAIVPGQKIEDLLFYRGRGCKHCNDEGYKGREGIYEVLEMNNDLAKIIQENGTAQDLRKIATSAGMLTMLQDGFLKAKSGVTTIEEILRVTKE
ncbi:MAG: Flp pilus assembly complex ATPase component TadA [Candidatus Kerfeldbacteria bacterium]|nr:Flp pilus assembly complex ATPase component TadA [Candidatus Kerfeldbacteria bacterium]